MSLSKPKVNAPPVIGAMDFWGIKNNIILLEYDDNDNALRYLHPILKNKVFLLVAPDQDDINDIKDCCYTGLVLDAISKACRAARSILNIAPDPLDFIIFHRIDLMDIHKDPKLRGAHIKGQLGLIGTKKILKGANIILTSGQKEFAARTIADRFIDLK